MEQRDKLQAPMEPDKPQQSLTVTGPRDLMESVGLTKVRIARNGKYELTLWSPGPPGGVGVGGGVTVVLQEEATTAGFNSRDVPLATGAKVWRWRFV